MDMVIGPYNHTFGAMLFSRLKQKTDGLTQMMRCKPVVSTPRNLRYFTSGRHAASMLHASNWGLVAMALPIFGSANPRRRKYSTYIHAQNQKERNNATEFIFAAAILLN
jgi:hypothetical protein